MTQLQVELVNPRAGRLLRELEAMNLIAIKNPEPACDDAEVSSPAAVSTTSLSPESFSPEGLPEGFPPMLLGKIPLSLYGSVKILGDIISPIDVEWNAMK
ncbi:MAG: hypothetical protein ACRC46_08310 [Thermoguttaceae bacterium]